MISAGDVARINVSEHAGNDGRIVDVIGKLNERYWLVTDGSSFNGYEPGTIRNVPMEERSFVERPVLAIEEWKLQKIY